MARKRSDNKKWKSRPSRKKIQANRNRKPCKIRKNNSKPSRPTKPSQQRRKVENHKNRSCTVSPTFEVQSNIETFDARIVHNFLSERYLSEIRQSWYSCKCCTCEHPLCNMRTAKKEHEKYHDCFVGDTICSFCYDFIAKDDVPLCPHSRFRNIMEIPVTPVCLKLGFLEQRAIALMHCYMSILIIRGHQSAMKGQVVHCQVDVADNIDDLLPLPKCYEFMAVIQQKPMNTNGEIRSTVRYSVSAIQILRAIQYLIEHHIGYINKQVLPLEKIEEMFQCRTEDVAPIRIIDSYAYNNSTTSAPIILDADEAVLGPSSKVRVRRGRKFKDEEIQKNIKESQIKDINKNYLHQNEIYEQVDPNNDPDLLQLAKEKKEFFERLGCRFGSPFELANETHFRTYKEARILTRGDRDIIIKRLTEESRRIIPYNLHFLKKFRCNHDIQVITDPWASAEYLFSYVSKDAHMEKNLVYQTSNCTCSSLMEAKAILLKTGNAILSHRQVGKVEASWTVLGIPLYHSSIRCKSLYISLPWEEERILKRGRTQVTSIDDFVESLTHRYVKRPFTPSVINHMTLFEFLTWFDYDRSSSIQLQETLKEPLVENPLWRTDFNQPPLLKTSNYLPRIVLSCGSVLIQHKEPACISFTCRYDDSMLAMYSMLSIGIPYRDPIEEFLGENDLNAIHQLLLKSKPEILQRFSTLPGAYKIQMINAIEHLCDF
ncbi:unnamed protein product [Rotaria sp. Silwood2]|nr:unnamed protein product [Rotaria sp. Silwood2]